MIVNFDYLHMEWKKTQMGTNKVTDFSGIWLGQWKEGLREREHPRVWKSIAGRVQMLAMPVCFTS